MRYALTLMAHPRAPLPGNIIEVMDGVLAAAGLDLEGVSILSEGLAIDGFFDFPGNVGGPDLSAAFASTAYDWAVTAEEGRRKSLLVADMDSTIITSESLDELARLSGKGDAVAEITARTMRGELDFEEALLERTRMIAGASAELTRQLIGEVVLNEGAGALVATMRASGARTILASGGFTFMTEALQSRLGFHEHYANSLIVEDGLITGEVGRPVLGQDAKLECLERAIADLGIGPGDVIAVGDGANDRAMIERAGIGVAYRGKDILKAAADVRLDHADLRGVLWVQGYRDDEITAEITAGAG
jgi:phosphoserine phosphatase